MTWTILRADQHTEMPWRNGAGTTLEVARSPRDSGLDTFDWRMSFARVEQGGPFSGFPGIDRVILLVRGGRLLLDVATDGGGEHHDLARFQPLAFPGECPVDSRITEPSLDFNLMTRRDRLRGELAVRRLGAPLDVRAPERGERHLVVLDGRLVVRTEDGDLLRLAALDVAGVECPGTVAADGGEAVVALVDVLPRHP